MTKTSDTSPNYIAVDPDGNFRPVPPTYDGIKDGVHDATFDVVRLPDGEHVLFIDDNGMLDGSALNIPASLLAGIALYGPVVLTGDADDEGETQLPTLKAANAFMTLARLWQLVRADAERKNQLVDVFANADDLPPPTVVGLTEDQFDRWLSGADEGWVK